MSTKDRLRSAKANKHMSGPQLLTRSDHSYNKTNPLIEQAGVKKLIPSENGTCNGCKNKLSQRMEKKNIECGFCEKQYCLVCSNLERPEFEALSVVHSVSWYCIHCINAVPGVSNVLMRLDNVEAQCQSLDERVAK